MSNTEYRVIPGFPKYRAGSDGHVYGPRGRKKARPDSDGYLRVSLLSGKRVATRSIHSLVALAFHGPRPDGLQIRHMNNDKSDNRPGNLAYGTGKENAADRRRFGTHVTKATLTQGQVEDIRELLQRRVLMGEIAKKFGVSRTTVAAIKTGKTWSHVPSQIDRAKLAALPHAHQHFTADLVRQVRQRLANGESGRSLAREYGVRESLISRIKNRKAWGKVA
jgi:hypothetical protein